MPSGATAPGRSPRPARAVPASMQDEQPALHELKPRQGSGGSQIRGGKLPDRMTLRQPQHVNPLFAGRNHQVRMAPNPRNRSGECSRPQRFAGAGIVANQLPLLDKKKCIATRRHKPAPRRAWTRVLPSPARTGTGAGANPAMRHLTGTVFQPSQVLGNEVADGAPRVEVREGLPAPLPREGFPGGASAFPAALLLVSPRQADQQRRGPIPRHEGSLDTIPPRPRSDRPCRGAGRAPTAPASRWRGGILADNARSSTFCRSARGPSPATSVLAPLARDTVARVKRTPGESARKPRSRHAAASPWHRPGNRAAERHH